MTEGKSSAVGQAAGIASALALILGLIVGHQTFFLFVASGLGLLAVIDYMEGGFSDRSLW